MTNPLSQSALDEIERECWNGPLWCGLSQKESRVVLDSHRALAAEVARKDEALKDMEARLGTLRPYMVSPVFIEHFVTGLLTTCRQALSPTPSDTPTQADELGAVGTTETSQPIPMILLCPSCGMQHIDVASAEWSNPPHCSHLCQGCDYIWRPADVPTEGVPAIQTRGKNDSPPSPPSRPSREAVARMVDNHLNGGTGNPPTPMEDDETPDMFCAYLTYENRDKLIDVLAPFPPAPSSEWRPRVAAALRERAEWLRSEYLNGGDFEHLNAREKECISLAEKIIQERFPAPEPDHG